MSYDKLPGEWYGPTTAAYVLRDLATVRVCGFLSVCVGVCGCVCGCLCVYYVSLSLCVLCPALCPPLSCLTDASVQWVHVACLVLRDGRVAMLCYAMLY